MKNWFTSLNGALTLTALAWVSQLWRTLIDATQGFHSNATEGGLLMIFTLAYTVVLAGWAYAIHSASRGSRGGLMAAFALNALFWLAIAVATPLFYCSGWCSSSAINTANALNLILGLLAGVALTSQLGQKKAGEKSK
jgi:hypothetical protein